MRQGILSFIFVFFFAQLTFSSARVLQVSPQYPIEICALLASPGDFILQHITEDSRDSLEFGWGVVALTRTKDILNLKIPNGLNFSHSEVITDIQKAKNIVSWSFYPALFGKAPFKRKEGALGWLPEPGHELLRRYANHSAMYRMDFSIYRVVKKGESLSYRELALEKTGTAKAREKYAQNGTCADFVNYAYGEHITDWWNFVPGLDVWINSYFPPAAISTTDDLAESPDTQKICEVSEYTNLVYPRTIKTSVLVKDLELNLSSPNETISEHAANVKSFLIKNGALGQNGEILFDVLSFSKDSEKEVTAPPKRQASSGQKARQRFFNYKR